MFNSNTITIMKKVLFMFAALAAIVACGDKGATTPEPPTPPTPDPVLTVSETAIEFVADGEAKTFTLTANNAWTLTVPEWLTADKASDETADNTVVTVTAAANETGADLSGTIVVTAGGLTKNIAVSQVAKEVEEPSVSGNATYELTSTTALKYASDLQDGHFYVLHSNHFNTKCWKSAEGQLTMTEKSGYEYASAEVFQWVDDQTNLDTTFDDYGNYACGYWKNCENGQYVSSDFAFTSNVASALNVEYANNWGGTDAANELYVFDVYVLNSGSAPYNTIWYTEKAGLNTFHLATNGYQNEGNVPTTMRKWLVYEVAVVE